MRRGWDVVVVGARVAGAATALQLARAGQRVLCLDRTRRGSDTVSTHALMRAGVLLLDRWGVIPAITAAGTPPIRRTVFDYSDDRVEISIKPTAGVDALYAPRRTVLDAALAEAAENAGAVMEFGTTVTGLHRSAGGRVNGVQLRRSGRDDVVPARFVVGADGRDSIVARQAPAPVTVAGGNRAAYLYSYWSGLPVDGYEWIYRTGLSAGLIPTGRGLCCLFVGGAKDDVRSVVHRANGPTHAYRSLAERVGLGERLRDATRTESVRYLHGLPAGYLRQAHGPGWTLVGDAGHWLDPISTHGITSALRDADLLAHALVTTAPDGERREHALREYQQVRDRLSLPLLRSADEIAGYRWDMPRLRALLRAIASAMSDEVDQLVGQPAA